jgi:Dynein heavy chain, N-terminal region 2
MIHCTTLHYTLHYTTQDSIPLIVNLKNDAMKPRHWAKLMEATGVKFDAASFKSLTLANIFAMELHKYSSDVDEIVNAAVQEQKIETEVRVTLSLLQTSMCCSFVISTVMCYQ